MLAKLFQHSDVPKKYRANFQHLYFDIAWFGVLNGTAINFLNVYATRLGASGLQIGMLSAMPAIVSLFLAIPAGHWLAKQHTGRAVFWSSILFRSGYVLWVLLPWLFNEQGQIWALISLTFLMAIPLTPLGVGFNALFAESVPARYRAQVAGTRNVTFAIAFMLTSLVAGYILKNISFPEGYQIVFAIGAFGAAMSSYHLYHIKPLPEESTPLQPEPQPAPQQQTDSPRSISSLLRLDIWKTSFRNVLIALFFFHLTHQISTPIYPLFNVRILHLNDSNIGNGTAIYYLTVLLGSTQFRKIAHRHGHKKVTGWGVAGMALYPITLALVHNVWQFYAVSFLGGFLWAMVNGAYANYMLENIPPNDRPTHLAWYNISLNVALLLSSLAGPAIADAIGLAPALILFGVFRILAGVIILKWG